jgi:hypothetical protein
MFFCRHRTAPSRRVIASAISAASGVAEKSLANLIY